MNAYPDFHPQNQPVAFVQSFHTKEMPALRTQPTPYQKSLDAFMSLDTTTEAEAAQADRQWMARTKTRYAAVTGIEPGLIILTRQETGRHLYSASVNLNRIDGAAFVGKCTISGNMITDQFSELQLIHAEEGK